MLAGVSLQVEDVRYLVDTVWASRSAIHGSSDIYNLVFVRWERRIDWSPWNCILLSREETSAHLELEDVHKVHKHTHMTHLLPPVNTVSYNALCVKGRNIIKKLNVFVIDLPEI